MVSFIVGVVVGYLINKYQDVITAKVKDILENKQMKIESIK